MSDLAWLDATATADLVRRGEVSPPELVDAAIARIEKLDGELNAVIHKQFDRARTEAAGDLPDGPFKGVPFLLKDAVQHFAGDPEHFGMRALKNADHHATSDTWLAQRFRAAGFVTLGRTNVPEMATTITTESLAYGPARNPWSTGHSTGGSSGGAAAAVASGMVPVAHGNDMGGSIRVPASHCGLVGLKPTRARTTLGPDLGELWGPITHEHVLCRSVRDTAAVLDAIAGAGVGDPYSAPLPERPFIEEVGVAPRSLRVGVRTVAHPEVAAAVATAVRLLEGLGHHVEDDPCAALDDPLIGESVMGMFPAIVSREVDRWSAAIGRPIELDELEPFNAGLTEMGRAVTGTGWLTGLEGVQRWARSVAQWFADGFDLLVLPVFPEPPPPIGELTVEGQGGDLFALVMRIAGLTVFTFPFNFTGQPAISVPLHWTADGLPIGVQIVAPYGREDVLLRVASQLEHAQPWADRRPPVSA
ncbi:MAG: amidase [Acidimicrobiaceae bacterium]